MEDKPNYYAIIPAEVRYDEELSDKAKLLYGEISALANKNGYCFANNKYFAELYGVDKSTITRLLKQLENKGYIEKKFTFRTGTKEILNRYMQICTHPIAILHTGICKNKQDNNTSNNNIERKNIGEPIFDYDWMS